MNRTKIFDNQGNDLMEMFARQREKYSPEELIKYEVSKACLLYTSPSPRDYAASRMLSSA